MRTGGRSTITIGADTVDRDGLEELAANRAGDIAGAPVVAVVAHPALSTVATVLAGLRARVTVVPLSPDAGGMERNHILTDSGAALLVDGGHISMLPPPPRSRVVNDVEADLLLYTSGTTGLPKGVPISMAAVRACIDGLADAWGWSKDDVLVHGLPLHHVHGLVLGVLGPLAVGSGLTHTGRPTPTAYAAAGGTMYFGVPTVWTRIASDAAAARALSSARLLVSGSAALPGPVFDSLLAQAGQAPVERYGMTETLITLAARADHPRSRGSVGAPLPGIRARIVDEHGHPAAPDEIGELEVSGATVFSGYLNRPEATSESFTPDGWFRTGDIASAGADGVHRIVGRASSDLIKTGGYRVGAGEVEDALLTHPSVAEAAVVGEPDDDLGQRIVAYVVSDGADEQGLIQHVATALSAHKRPRAIHFLTALPRNSMGKVDKGRLRD